MARTITMQPVDASELSAIEGGGDLVTIRWPKN
jgi:hypothetical protein